MKALWGIYCSSTNIIIIISIVFVYEKVVWVLCRVMKGKREDGVCVLVGTSVIGNEGIVGSLLFKY